MKALLKYLGVIIELIGVAFLIIPKIMQTTSNATLIAGGSCLVAGIITFIIINKFVVTE